VKGSWKIISSGVDRASRVGIQVWRYLSARVGGVQADHDLPFGWPIETHDHPPDGCLAAATLATRPEDLTARDREVNAIHAFDVPCTEEKGLGDRSAFSGRDFEQGALPVRSL